MYVQYKSHNDATLIYMDNTLSHYRTLKMVFLIWRADHKAKTKANAMRTELVKKQQVDNETNAEFWTHSKKRHKMNAWREIITCERDVSKEFDSDFNVLKIHLMSHWVEQSHRYEALQQYSTDRH
jgi:hypothetical protein